MDAAVKCYSLADSVCHQYLGVTGCCTGFPCYVASQGFCYCDITCHFFGDCCSGIDLTCPLGGGGGSVGGEYCSSAQSGTLSFVDGVGSSGRLRICDSNEWKTVCSKGFDENEARVACASFGYSPTNFTIYSASQYGQGQDTAIYEKDLKCTGSEDSLTSCVSNDTCCGHHHDVGLQCQPSCADGQIRLVGGATPMEGRVEVCYQGRWGTVCDDSWGINDARVACRMAGFPWTGTVQYSGYYTTINYGQGVGPIWLDDLACSGSENSLFNCSGNAVGVHNCGHYEDASVKCAAGPCDLAGINTCCDPTTTNCQGNTTEGVCHCSADCEEHGDCCIDYSLTCG
jgi:deleted-in-malignant-brain-tumors protein 1